MEKSFIEIYPYGAMEIKWLVRLFGLFIFHLFYASISFAYASRNWLECRGKDKLNNNLVPSASFRCKLKAKNRAF